MNRKLLSRKLHHTLLALSASAAVFGVLLLAGTPALPSADTTSALMLPNDTLSTHMLLDDTLTNDNISADATDVTEATELVPPIDIETGTPTSAIHHRSPDRIRSLLALPYFSFAQGLRPTRS